ncbi:MAG TPA: YfcE family phosphodiesterase [Bacillota bacterium]|nr:YfcE family phosphodiesterase [Bacillota bacterium]
MKLLIFSDNHRDREAIREMLDKNPGFIHQISLGDSEMRESELTELNIYGVKGNYPFEPKFPKDMTLDFEGIRVFLTHGHLFSVKLGLSSLLNHCLYNDIQIACFGHTHQAMIKEIEGVLFINPGSLSRTRLFSKASYAILEITEKAIEATIKSLDGDIIYTYQKNR